MQKHKILSHQVVSGCDHGGIVLQCIEMKPAHEPHGSKTRTLTSTDSAQDFYKSSLMFPPLSILRHHEAQRSIRASGWLIFAPHPQTPPCHPLAVLILLTNPALQHQSRPANIIKPVPPDVIITAPIKRTLSSPSPHSTADLLCVSSLQNDTFNWVTARHYALAFIGSI